MESNEDAPYEPGPSSTTEARYEMQSKDAKLWAMLLHLSQLTHFVLPGIGGFVVPIVIWQIKKDEYAEIDEHGRIVTNWMISWFIYMFISGLLCIVIIGIIPLVVFGLLGVIFPVIGGLKANQGEYWKYPLTINFL